MSSIVQVGILGPYSDEDNRLYNWFTAYLYRMSINRIEILATPLLQISKATSYVMND